MSRHLDKRVRQLLAIVLAMLMNMGLVSAIVRAQDEKPAFPVYSIACDAYVTMQNSASGAGIPPECHGIGGVTISAFDTEGTALSTCTTGANGTCMLGIGYNGTRIFTQDKAGIPDGYRPDTSVQRLFTYTEFAEVVFHNYRTDVYPQKDYGTGTIKVQARICPDKYAGDDFATDCGELIPPTDEFAFANGTFNSTGTDGNATLREVPTGDVAVVAGQSPTTGDVYFSCTPTKDPATVLETSVTVTAQYDMVTRDFEGHVNLEPRQNLTCLWYEIPNLDRGLWNTLVNPMATGESAGTFVNSSGLINLYVLACPSGFAAKDLPDASENCTDKPGELAVSAIGTDGTELTSGTTNDDGNAQISLEGKPVTDFLMSIADRADISGDTIGCFANLTDQNGDATDPLYQAVTLGDGSWSIPGFGDDQNGILCFWYLAT
jgi:hypothetical protein